MKIIALNASGKGQAADFMHSIGNYASTKGVTYCYAVGANANREYHDFFDSSLFSDPFFIQSII